MSGKQYKLETVYEVWSPQGECIEIGFDREGLGLIEIRLLTDDGRIADRLSFPLGAATLIARAINRCEMDREAKETRESMRAGQVPVVLPCVAGSASQLNE